MRHRGVNSFFWRQIYVNVEQSEEKIVSFSFQGQGKYSKDSHNTSHEVGIKQTSQFGKVTSTRQYPVKTTDGFPQSTLTCHAHLNL